MEVKYMKETLKDKIERIKYEVAFNLAMRLFVRKEILKR